MSLFFNQKVFSEAEFRKSYYALFFGTDYTAAQILARNHEASFRFSKVYTEINAAIELFKNNDLGQAKQFIEKLPKWFEEHLFIIGLKFLIEEGHTPLPEYKIFNDQFNFYLHFFYRDFMEKALDWVAFYFSEMEKLAGSRSITENSLLPAYLGEISLYRFVSLFKNNPESQTAGNALLMGTALISLAELMNRNESKMDFHLFIDRPLSSLPDAQKKYYQGFIQNKKTMLKDAHQYSYQKNEITFYDPIDFLFNTYPTMIYESFDHLDALFEKVPENWEEKECRLVIIYLINALDLTSRLYYYRQIHPKLEVNHIYIEILLSLEDYLKKVIFFIPSKEIEILKDYLQKNTYPVFEKFVQSEKIVQEFFKKLS